MDDEINFGEYLADYEASITSIMEQLDEATSITSRLTELINSEFYAGNGSNDLQLFTSSLDSNVYRLSEFYKVADSYLYSVLSEYINLNQETTQTIESVGD